MNTVKLQDESGAVIEAIGYIDCGGFVVPRAKLAEVLPDIERFERTLQLAKFVDVYMSEHDGEIPSAFSSLAPEGRRDVAATLRELGMLAASAADRLERRGDL